MGNKDYVNTSSDSENTRRSKRLPEYNKPEAFELRSPISDPKGIFKYVKEYFDMINDLNSEKCKTFANTLVYHMRTNNVSIKELSERTGLSQTIISNYCNAKKQPKDARNVLTLCIGLKLDIAPCYDMFKKINYDINTDTMRNIAYRYIINTLTTDLDECNIVLSFFGEDTLPYKH